VLQQPFYLIKEPILVVWYDELINEDNQTKRKMSIKAKKTHKENRPLDASNDFKRKCY